MSYAMLIKVRWLSLYWAIMVLVLFLMKFNLLNNLSLEQFVAIGTKYIQNIISTFENVSAIFLSINSL